MTTTVLNTKISKVENAIPNTSNLVTRNVLNIKITEVKNKIPDNSKYITTEKFNKLTAENFAARLKQADLLNKNDFDNKRTSFNRRITSNKTKHLEVQITKDYDVFIGRIYFTSNDGSQNTFVYQPTLDALELKKDKITDYVISWKSKVVFNSKLKPLYAAFLNSKNLSEYRIGIKLV